VVIVIATRSDLRDGFDMADEAFALSPIGARATQPNEADYEAIREAFMETARGRWFLGEYAKRNRNADTTMVLDAVARIEETLAAQHMPPEFDNRLPEALAAIRSAVDEAAEAATAAIDGLGLDESLAPIRKGARIVKEISWRWREIGADSRICDLIDSQLSAIEGSCGRISELDPRPAVSDAFGLIRTRIDGFAEDGAEDAVRDDEMAVPPAGDEVMETAAPATAETEASAIAAEAAPVVAAAGIADSGSAEPELRQDVAVTSAVAVIEVADDVVAADTHHETFPDQAVAGDAALDVIFSEAVLDETAFDETALDETALNETALDEIVLDGPVLDEAVADDAGLDEDSLDEALLDVVALAMAAPDPEGEIDYSIDDAEHDEMVEPAQAATTNVVAMPEPAAPQMQISVPQAAAPVAPQSIGSALLANGFLEQHRMPANDPLAPIRRMSQAEKIAFFS
jgi:hypothetical protein